jgi:hypothetical protein
MNTLNSAQMRAFILQNPCDYLPLHEQDYTYTHHRPAGGYDLCPDELRELQALKLFLLERSAFALLRDRRYTLALIRLACLRDKWKADLEGWKRKTHQAQGQFESLLRHLVDRYKVPRFLMQAWSHEEDFAVEWYLHLASGGSARKLPGLPFPLSKKAAHLVRHIPAHLGITDGLLWAQVRSMGGAGAVFRAIAGSFLGQQAYLEEFWIQAIAWIIRQPGRDNDQVGPVIDYLNHRHGERNTNFSLKGRTWNAVVRDMNRWHRDLRAARVEEERSWQSYIGNKYYVSLGKGARGENADLIRRPVESFISSMGAIRDHRRCMITITQILSDKQLRAEGNRMNHCVYSYRLGCQKGDLSIWSMRAWDPATDREEALLTLELRHGSRRIVQIRGKHNRRATRQEMEIVRIWAQREKLGISSYA